MAEVCRSHSNCLVNGFTHYANATGAQGGWRIVDNSKSDRPQYGGNHYKLPIEPIDFIMKNGLGFCEGNIIKYVTRHKAKGTPRADLLKARQYIDFLLNELPDTEENN